MGFVQKLFGRRKPRTVDMSRLDKIDQGTPQSHDGRLKNRKDTFHDATVITGSGTRLDGIAIDVSDKGARLRFQSTSGLSDIARVQIPALRIDRAVELRWIDVNDVGLLFKL